MPVIGGAPAIRLDAPPGHAEGPRFLSCDIAPARGMMLLQARAEVPSLGEVKVLAGPPLEEIAHRLDGGVHDFAGSASYAFGGALLFPYANRIRGRVTAGEQTIETDILGKTVRLPANHGGQGPGAEVYAMHGLILDRPADDVRTHADEHIASVRGHIDAGDFEGRWPGRLSLDIAWVLTQHEVSVHMRARNDGREASPVGIGWHPYFALPSGDRRQAVLSLPASSRTAVNNYDEVLPTGEVEPVEGTPYGFWPGKALGDLYLDDCFCDLIRSPLGEVVVEIADLAAQYGVRVVSPTPQVTAVQTYAPPDKAFVVLEPQFNLANPFGAEWHGRDTGMVALEPGQTVEYSARIELFVPRAAHG